jgi:hypothetical protein
LDLLALEQQLPEQALLAGTVQILHLQQLARLPLAAAVGVGLPLLFITPEMEVQVAAQVILETHLRLAVRERLVKAMLVEAF